MKKKNNFLAIALIAILGFFYRYLGIYRNLSFWNDESHTAIFSRGILLYGKPVNELGRDTGFYQMIQYYITSLSFKIFGISEFAGRFPSIVAGTLLILSIFFIVRKLLGFKSAVIASFLVAFSQIQLAWSTQLRPYIWLELITLFIIYFLYHYLSSNKMVDKNIAFATALCFVATYFHGIGLINFTIILFAIIYKSVLLKKYIYIVSSIPIGFIIYLVLKSSRTDTLVDIFNFNFNLLHYRIFFTHNYMWLIIGVIVGLLPIYKKNLRLLVLLLASIMLWLFIAVFKINSQYVRYSLPVFPLFYILFSAGIIYIAETVIKYLRIEQSILKLSIHAFILISFLSYPIAKEKIIIVPKFYYSINADVRENPIVDYKLAFSKIKNIIRNKKSVIVMDAWNDRVPWYLPKQKFIFLNRYEHDKIDYYFGEKQISTIAEFKQEKIKYDSGVIVVENWESMTSPDLQMYIRKTMKHEFDVNNLPYNENDKWSISIYSWGM